MESRSNTASSEVAPAVAPTRPTLSNAALALIDARCVLCGSDHADPVASGYDFEYLTVPNTFQFVRCRTCGHHYLNPRPSEADLGTIYPPNYYAFSGSQQALVARVRRSWEAGKVRLYRDLVGAGPRRILDVGCGNGRFLSLLRDYGHAEWDLVGIDFDANAVSQCVARGFRAYVSRAEDFAPPQGEQFDAVIMLQLIEHVDDPAAICRRVFTLLRAGGFFIIETPNLAGWDYRLFAGRWWGHYHFPRHWNLFSTAALHRLLEQSGFAIARSEYLISTSAWTISLHNYFLDKGYPDWFVRFFHYQNPLLLGLFVVVDTLRARLGFQTSNQRVIAQKPR
ncbi:MAG TPA: class I SAM-dependent methyltransferase [Candidatus Margulisiibacteriota bacterium]|nr:class I SAM-dependent methyltransferase [Candidatus Margulisiibacteriota bacterium]